MICRIPVDLRSVPLFEAVLDQVLVIEQESYPRPWTRQHFLDEMASPHAIALVAMANGNTVAGYICCRIIVDEAEVLDLAVAPSFRCAGVGSFLLNSALHQFRAGGIQTLNLEVRISNSAAINLYRRFCFLETGVRRKYYENSEDALLMQLHISEQKEL